MFVVPPPPANEAERLEGLVAVSIGAVTADPSSDFTAGTLVSAADARLYEAKRAGRNRVVAGLLP
ncbi:diguanylate cyclase domain-containing protein [Microvirga tunisiensis]|uniref:Diguanylate cyclase n=1 Tax=Microvirga tunisiensis TaxID=2108360 RepID=A0A5N7MSK1_9HYPH|nr:diguanylate cyclase [Microvirga tunisiensis]MPR29982.1 diguanylate cyclase [Microvirga tunisiensis]